MVRRSGTDIIANGTTNAVQSLNHAYGELRKASNGSNNTSLLDLQGRLHAWYCSTTVDHYRLGQGPNFLDIHTSLYFLLWHRGLLYFHEKMLLRLSKDPTLRLPYWDWSPTSADNFYQRATNLERPNRCGKPGYPKIGGDPSHNRGAAENSIKLTDYSAFNEAFLGPHQNVHNEAGGLMPQFQWNAWDPIFYGHHGNCDRYFRRWQLLHQPDPASLSWLNDDNTWLYFYDECGSLVKVLAKDLWDVEKLGYRYDDESTEATEAHTNPSVGPPITIQSSLSVPTIDALNGPHQAVWADLSPLAAGTKAAQSRLVFVLHNKTDRLPSNAAKLYKDDRFLGQFTQDQKPEKKNHSHRSWTVDASKTLRHFIKSGNPNDKVWLATVDLDPSGKPGKQRLLKADTRLKLRYYEVKPRSPRSR